MSRYLDQLGMTAKYHTKVYCWQTLIGRNYGLINKTTFMPNPDYYRWGSRKFCYIYYAFCLKIFAKHDQSNLIEWMHQCSALLWNRLMGTGVLAVDRRNIAPHLRTYAHCSKGKVSLWPFWHKNQKVKIIISLKKHFSYIFLICCCRKV